MHIRSDGSTGARVRSCGPTSVRGTALAGLLALAGCAQEALPDETRVDAREDATFELAHAERPAVHDLRPRILAVRGQGMCATTSDNVNIGEGIFRVSSKSTLNADTARSGRCTLTVDLAVPAGYSLGGGNLCAGFRLTDNDGRGMTSADVTLRASYPGVAARPVSTTLRAVGQDAPFLTACGAFPELWSPTCTTPEQESVVSLELDVDVRVPRSADLALVAIEGDLGYDNGSLYRVCSGAGVSLPGPSEPGEGCRGPNKQPCASGLVCNATVVNAYWLTGVCDLPRPTGELQGAKGFCGGPQALRCKPGLRCAIDRRAIRFDGARAAGRCAPPEAAMGEACDGEDLVPCASGLRCEEGRCVNSPGTRASDPCGAVEPRCGEGLSCSAASNVCQNPTPSVVDVGEACGEGVARCQLNLICDESTHRCRKSIGLYNERCDEVACQAPLVCLSSISRCRSENGAAGAPCIVPQECASGSCVVGADGIKACE